jgi:signal transduction histidine kinase
LYGLNSNKDLWFYGGIALLGTVMTGLAIRTARKIPEEESEIQALLKDLREQKERAENLAQIKSEFLNHVSHELRTPLAVILGYLECIIDGLYGQIDSKHKEILTVVSRQSNDLKYMIDRLLIFSRLEAGKYHLKIEEFSIGQILGDLKPTYDFLTQQKGLHVIWDTPEEVPAIKSDRERFKEVINNLLQNALKYTEKGSISLGIRYLPAIDSVEVEVSDTGAGIPQAYLNTIFDPFVQVGKTSPQETKGGIGLGLSIVKKHVEHLKGTITVESEVAKGTTFRVTLPRIYREAQRRKNAVFLKLLRRTGT